MPMLRIQHAVPNFDAWKRAFDSDPMDRKKSGVRGYRVYRATTEPDLVMIDLDFATLDDATAMLARLRQLWSGPGGAVMRNPAAWILDEIEDRKLD